MSGHVLFSAYAGLARLGGPLIRRHIARRAERGKEDPARIAERFGRAGHSRPHGALVWLHAASVGEALSALPLIDGLCAARPAARVLMTTGTVSSAKLIAARAPELLHQFVPVDTPAAVTAFLDHWRPDIGLWVESELWPTLVLEASKRMPTALVNARLSEKSARRWALLPGAAQALLCAFTVRAAQTDETRARLIRLGAPADATVTSGNLKLARAGDAPEQDALAAITASIGARPVWLAASTHPGEEAMIFAAHNRLSRPDLLTIIAPRHPERGIEVARLAAQHGLSVTMRSAGEEPDAQVYVADTLGEMPLWYALAPIAYLGGGMGDLGGHNPVELAQAGVIVLSGPRVANAAAEFSRLEHVGAARFVENGEQLAGAVRDLFARADLATLRERARACAAPDSGPVKATLAALAPLLERL